jgi:signal transduction histidine kinase
MKGRWGLQWKMTTTYVAVSAVAVLLAEAAVIGVAALSPSAAPLSEQDLLARTHATAGWLAGKLAVTIASGEQMRGTDLGTPGVAVTPGLAQPDGTGGIAIPQTTTPVCGLAAASLAVVVAQDGTVQATSDPGCYPVGGHAGGLVPALARPHEDSGHARLAGSPVVWATAPLTVGPGRPNPKASDPEAVSPVHGTARGSKLFGLVYIQVPAAAQAPAAFPLSATLLRTGLVVLALAIPVGIAFGLLSTRRLTRRLQRLAASTLEVAEGGFQRRIPVSGADEVSQLEENFNRMAGRLEAAMDARRELAEANARHQERSRIARELHDSISQELFSLSVLAGGLRRALPAGSAVLTEAETMERTAADTMREMQSLLLALRPVALEDGLAGALAGVCRAYRERLGADVRADLAPLALDPELEHAILRITQEGLANAVRHAGAGVIRVRLDAAGQQVELDVADDGRGFDPARPDPGGLGLSAMRDRAAEQGGTLTVHSAPGAGTVVRARFPVAAP